MVPVILTTQPNTKTNVREALHDICDFEDVPLREQFNQVNMIQEVLDEVRDIVQNQVVKFLPHFNAAQIQHTQQIKHHVDAFIMQTEFVNMAHQILGS